VDRGTATAAARTDPRAAAIACEERPPGATRLLLLVCLEAVARPHLWRALARLPVIV
jgi:hypothetical protein